MFASLGSRHTVEPRSPNTQTHEKVCVRCVFEFLNGLDQTQCLQPIAGHSVKHHLDTQKPKLKHNCELDDLRAGFEIAKGYRDWA